VRAESLFRLADQTQIAQISPMALLVKINGIVSVREESLFGSADQAQIAQISPIVLLVKN
jgi:hypothetical protein